VQSPQYAIDSLNALLRTTIAPATGASNAQTPQLLGNLVTVRPTAQIAVASRYNLAPATDIYVSVQGRDMGSITGEVRKLVEQMRPQLPRGAQISMLGQVQTMSSSFLQLGVGLALAVVMVYLLIVVNFQSWVDAIIIISALPAALAGICWMLLLTATHLSVPAMTGAIMTMGVATANSILIVSFARQRIDDGLDPVEAALDAGATRIRPVLMTALAMIIGMIPMALGWGEGAEQNAPLGRAVIGGLLFATVSTLFLVPVVFAGVHRRLERRKLLRSAAPGIAEGNP
jgi:multidrug efflux pump subunit AcrB